VPALPAPQQSCRSESLCALLKAAKRSGHETL